MDSVIKILKESDKFKQLGAYKFLRKRGNFIIEVNNVHPVMNVNLAELNVFFLKVSTKEGLENDIICPLDVDEGELFTMVNKLLSVTKKVRPEKLQGIKNQKPPIYGAE